MKKILGRVINIGICYNWVIIKPNLVEGGKT